MLLNAELEVTNRGVMAIYDIERTTALALQQNLLLDALTTIDRFAVAVRYRASTENAEVGSDFYELFSLGGEKIAFAVGDVVGHSLEAAMVMAQLRTGIRCYLLDGHGPVATLERLNRLLLQFHHDWTATVCCAIYDRATGHCEIANADHLPPLLRSGCDVAFLPIGGPLLGFDAQSVASHTFTLDPGNVLCSLPAGSSSAAVNRSISARNGWSMSYARRLRISMGCAIGYSERLVPRAFLTTSRS